MESKLEFPQSAILTPYNYFEWKPKIQLHLRSRGLFRITMETEVEPTSAVEKSRYFNRMDEAFGILCLSISPELLFHVESCSTPNQVWKILEELFGKQNEMLKMVEDSIAIYRNCHESFSLEPEDPHVASLYATNYVQGLQETDGGDPNQLEAAACCKHNTAYDVDNLHEVEDTKPYTLSSKAIQKLHHVEPKDTGANKGVAATQRTSRNCSTTPHLEVEMVMKSRLRLLDRGLGGIGEREQWRVPPADSRRGPVFDGRLGVWTPVGDAQGQRLSDVEHRGQMRIATGSHDCPLLHLRNHLSLAAEGIRSRRRAVLGPVSSGPVVSSDRALTACRESGRDFWHIIFGLLNHGPAKIEVTRYPQLYVSSLSPYARSLKPTLCDLVKAAMNVSLINARTVSVWAAGLKGRSAEMSERETAALNDCIQNFNDTVDEIQKSLKEMDQLQRSNFNPEMNDMQTFMSTILTDQDSCLNGFEDVKAAAGKISAMVIFLATIMGIITQPLPLGAVALMGLGAAVLTKTLTFAAAFSAFGDQIPWLIALAFFFARGFIKTGLDNRVAYQFVALFGSSSLGLGYNLVFSEALLAPAIPSVSARAGGIFLPLVKALAYLHEDCNEKIIHCEIVPG